MKRFLLCLLLVALAGVVFGQSFPRLVPKDAVSMALGGSFSSLSTGYSSFYANPAGFASDKGEFTVVDASVWAYLKPTAANVNGGLRILNGQASRAETLSTLDGWIGNNGVGGGFSAGLGYAGKGIGIGFYAVSDNYAQGATLSTPLSSTTTFNGVLGIGVPFMLGNHRLNIGGDVRPFYRIDSDSTNGAWSLYDLVTAGNLGSQAVYAGFGLAADFGASLELGTLTLGLSVRDLSPSYLLEPNTVGGVLSSLSKTGLPQSSVNSVTVMPRPFIATGLSWKPRALPKVVEPAFYFEVQDPLSIYLDKDSPWMLFHLGAELKLIDLLSLRVGLNEGWLTGGFGLDFHTFKLDAAAFTEELGSQPGDQGRSGIILEAAIRF